MTEAYIYDAVRSPRGKGRPDGALHEITPIDLAALAGARRFALENFLSVNDRVLARFPRYADLKSPVPVRNVGKVFEPLTVIAVVAGLAALFFQNRP